MNIKILLIPLLMLCGCTSAKKPLENQSLWTKPNNGLSAQLVITHEMAFGTKVLHPKILLRNDSKHSIMFLKCVYNAGDFDISSSDGERVQSHPTSRSGAQGAEVIIINPSECAEFDTYDYGYGISQNTNSYVLNTSSIQSVLLPGEYLVTYSLTMDELTIKKMLKSYDWIKDNPDTLWHGQLTIKDFKMVLK